MTKAIDKIKSSNNYRTLSKYFNERQMVSGIMLYVKQTSTYASALEMMMYWFKRNPYQLIEVPYITLGVIDSIVINLPETSDRYVAYTDPRRIEYLIGSVLDDGIDHGHAYVSKEQLYQKAVNIYLKNTPEDIATTKNIADVVDRVKHSTQYDVLPDSDYVISNDYKKDSYELAKRLTKYSKRPLKDLDEDIFSQAALSITAPNGMPLELSEEQIQTARNLLTQPISLLTGYAGVGKSTVIQVVTNYLTLTHADAQLCALSGKAAFNLSQATGVEARTIASILWRKDPLYVNYLIIDEISMVSENDLLELFRLCTKTTQIILLGDKAQLPAVSGVGVLTSLPDFLDENDFFYTKNLTQVYRQDGGSSLLKAATKIRNHETPELVQTDDSLFYKTGQIPFIVNAYLSGIKQYGADNVRILTPLNKNVNEINFRIQKQRSAGKVGHRVGDSLFYVDDAVLVTKNMQNVKTTQPHESVDLFNGFTGKVIDVTEYSVTVRFNRIKTGEETTDVVFSPFLDLPSIPGDALTAVVDHLTLGYCLTVHKSQGSTIPVVLYYFETTTTPWMMTNELLYTALTRASKRLLMITEIPVDRETLRPFVHSSAYYGKSSFLKTALEETNTKAKLF